MKMLASRGKWLCVPQCVGASANVCIQYINLGFINKVQITHLFTTIG